MTEFTRRRHQDRVFRPAGRSFSAICPSGPVGSSPRGSWEPVTPLEGGRPFRRLDRFAAHAIASGTTDLGGALFVSEPLEAVEDQVEPELESAAVASASTCPTTWSAANGFWPGGRPWRKSELLSKTTKEDMLVLAQPSTRVG